MSARHPFKQGQRDTRAHGVIEWYLGNHGADSGVEQRISPLAGHDVANRARLSIRRGARHYGLSAAAWVEDQDGEPCVYDCPDSAAPHAVVFKLHSRETAARYVVQQSGGDPRKLKYNPYAKRR